VFLPRQAPWLDDFLEELRAFPNGQYDDQVDSTSQFLTWWDKKGRFKFGVYQLDGFF
jgi:phage terminase large subunit-like protein